MSTRHRNILRLTRPGGGRLEIHPDEWPALQQAVTDALQLEADPAVSYEELPQGKFRAPSPLGDARTLTAEFVRFGVDRPLAGHHRTNFGSD
ncbi:hypothetical protein [Halomonas sp. JS92-SW72]|jgi:hypothetical protein|uniref:hypothetical protein n=1 Tax=Halomonas sp. JS92-SW72 TaxID=2306583 RepID=UPI000E5B0A54|nr:hypothetical protein [Halomonas sp. JS92-SW72]AXY43915.1 hypothetical protein D1793_17925 [Halomonas sp. JS92-SW72]